MSQPTRWLNYTGRRLDIYDADGITVIASLPCSGTAELDVRDVAQSTVTAQGETVTVYKKWLVGIKGLPEPQPGVGYIVRNPEARDGRQFRDDLWGMHIYVRNGDRIVGCKALIQFHDAEVKNAGSKASPERQARRRRRGR